MTDVHTHNVSIIIICSVLYMCLYMCIYIIYIYTAAERTKAAPVLSVQKTCVTMYTGCNVVPDSKPRLLVYSDFRHLCDY